MRIAVIGLGLIGGSIALAARERLGAHVCGFDRDPETAQTALARGLIERSSGTLAEALDAAEAAFVAVPVGALAQVLDETLAAAGSQCVVSDVGSVKRALVGGREDPRFVGGHPLAGAERSGNRHARADLFAGEFWYLTPAPSTSPILLERLRELIEGLGARPLTVDAETHDRLVATVSHLPHVLAGALVMQAVARTGAGDREAAFAAGPSFRDATRVAGAPASIWTDIYTANADMLGAAIADMIGRLEAFGEALAGAKRARIEAFSESAAAAREKLGGAR